ncbi:MAG: hypothetical protein HN348_22710 [Proteobacteria bacterium]|nr:hypothetical protein [Pseudomonadota bacterium]
MAFPLFSIGARGWRAKALVWGMGCLAIFFAVWAKGDWMKGYRWFSLAMVPGSVMFAVGVCEIANWVQRRFNSKTNGVWTVPGWMTMSLLGILIVPPNVQHTSWFLERKETGPFSVKRRVTYMQWVANKVHLDERPVVWDVDQGAHLFWSGFWMMDMAGLVDVSVAQHKFEKEFMREYIFEEWKPHFAHVHGGWASNSRIPTHPEWKRDYFEIPGYPVGKTANHIGNFIRKDLFLVDQWDREQSDRVVDFEDGVRLEGFYIPSPQAARTRSFYVEVGFSSTQKRTKANDFRVLLLLANDKHSASWDLPMGYDWYCPHQWEDDKVFWGKYALDLPKHLVEGNYEIGFVVLGGDGQVLQPLATVELVESAEDEESNEGQAEKPGPIARLSPQVVVGGANEAKAFFAVGEVRFKQRFSVVSVDDNANLAREDRERAYESATANQCAQAEEWWFKARKHRPKNTKWLEEFKDGVEDTLAGCWARKAMAEPERQVEYLEKSRKWDHHNTIYRQAAKPAADGLYAKGLAARELQDWETAYRLFDDTLRVDPQRSWARRYAEEARDYRLGLDSESMEDMQSEREARMERMRERRKKMGEGVQRPDEPARRPGDPRRPPVRPGEARPGEPVRRPPPDQKRRPPPGWDKERPGEGEMPLERQMPPEREMPPERAPRKE